MLQILQHQSTGEIVVADVPPPQCPEGGALISVACSLISAGTERSSVQKAQSSLVQRALKQPQEAMKVLESVRKDGVAATFHKVQNTLDSYKPLGYSVAGTVVESRADGFLPGDRVACAGNSYAYHAELVVAPKNLMVKIPDDSLNFEDAAYTTLGAIALQGVRQARLELGMSVAVIGLGLLGQITIQLAKAAGCRVLGLDVNEALFAHALRFGAEAALPSGKSSLGAIESFSRGLGVDAVIITAATESNEPVELALEAVRKRGAVVVVGAVGMNLPRSPFYEKEVDFRISCSYGPGRYDPRYEEGGADYPPAFVRWTENRNMQAFLDFAARAPERPSALTTHRFPIERAAEAYDLVAGKTSSDTPYLSIALTYPRSREERFQRPISPKAHSLPAASGRATVGCVGAGTFAQTYLLPELARNPLVRLRSLCTPTPAKAQSIAKRFGFERAETNPADVFSDAEVNLVVCASRHDSHGQYVAEALKAGKDIFVEKPLCISREELAAIEETLLGGTGNARVMVGFNRRFSQPLAAIRQFFERRQDPLSMIYRVNAGAVSPDSWIQDPAQGGRIIGEVCHFIDCMAFISGSAPTRVFAEAIASPNLKTHRKDTVSISIKFTDGSIGTVHYFANGSPALAKEYCEAFAEGKTAIMHNFERVELRQGNATKRLKFDGSKGHKQEMQALARAVAEGAAFPLDFAVIRAVTLATFAAEESLQIGAPVEVA
jgi:polar amino acid transport system substrate-binding protein